jgi:PleD family two-component response regulator
MNQQGKRRILAVLDDLFFRVKIEDAAKRAGLAIDFVKSEKEAFEKAAQDPLLIILDLNCLSVQPLALIAALKANEATRGVSVLGYVSHVQVELKQKAHDSGCDTVLARSALSQNLPQILRRHAAGAA